MDIKRKKELLKIADSISKDINKQGCGNYISKITNAIKISRDRNDRNILEDVLNKMKYTSFGGERQKKSYEDFLTNILKNPHYKIDFLNFEELDFIFSWVRRLVKTNISKDLNSYQKNNSSRKSNNIRNYNEFNQASQKFNSNVDDNDSPFAMLKNIRF